MGEGSRSYFREPSLNFLLALVMNPKRQPQQPPDLDSRAEKLSNLLAHLEQELLQLQEGGEVAPTGSWITRYQARGRTGSYWYYKWQAIDPVFPTAGGKMSRYKHLGKAGSPAYLEAVRQIVLRTQIDGLEQAINTLKAGWGDLCEEGMKNRAKSRHGSRK